MSVQLQVFDIEDTASHLVLTPFAKMWRLQADLSHSQSATRTAPTLITDH